MKMLLWNCLLAITWAALTRLSVSNLFLGFAFGYLVLRLSPLTTHRSNYFRKVVQCLQFAAYFLKELVVATIRVSHDVLTPTPYMKPAVIGIPLELETDLEIAFLAIVITLTPGSLALDVSSDRKTLYIHAMYAPDPDAVRQSIKDGFERRVRELLR